MDPQIIFILVVVFTATLLFMLDLLTPDVTAATVMLVLLLSGVITSQEAFAGFSSDTVIMFASLLIVTAGLIKTGIVDKIGGYLGRRFSSRPKLLLFAIMISVTVISAFLSNTATAAMFLPIVLGVTKKAGLSPSRYLLPMAFCSILSSSTTLVSTTTNIVVSGAMTQYQLAPIGMFELLPVGLPICVVGFLYMWFVAVKLMPERGPKLSPSEDFGLRPYLSDLLVLPQSKLIGQTLNESGLWDGSDVTVVRIMRNGRFLQPRAYARLYEGDRLIVEAESEGLLKIKEKSGVDITADAKLRDPEVDPEDLMIVEGLVRPDSILIGRSLKSSRFKNHYDVQVLALTRSGQQFNVKLSDIKLEAGDILLLQGLAEDLKAVGQSANVQILGEVHSQTLNQTKAWIVVFLFIAALVLSTLGILNAATSFLLAAVCMLLTGCISSREAYREIDWTLIVMVGSILSLGLSMEKTGTAKYIADWLVRYLSMYDPKVLLMGFFILTVALTQVMSNQAAAVLIIPVAIQTAQAFNLNPRCFSVMVAVASSCSFLTPLEPACLLVYGPGGYKFSDFARVGLLLTVIIMITALIFVPIFWPVK